MNLETLRKIKRLAEANAPESDNARRILELDLAKAGLSEADVVDDPPIDKVLRRYKKAKDDLPESVALAYASKNNLTPKRDDDKTVDWDALDIERLAMMEFLKRKTPIVEAHHKQLGDGHENGHH